MKTLDDGLRDLRLALAETTPPASVDRSIAQAVAKTRRRRAPKAFDRWLVWPLALAASIFAISFIARNTPPEELVPVAGAQEAGAFLPLVPGDEIARASDAYVLATRLPRPALAQLGLPVDPARVDQPVDAELLVRPDGAVLAFRFVN